MKILKLFWKEPKSAVAIYRKVGYQIVHEYVNVLETNLINMNRNLVNIVIDYVNPFVFHLHLSAVSPSLFIGGDKNYLEFYQRDSFENTYNSSTLSLHDFLKLMDNYQLVANQSSDFGLTLISINMSILRSDCGFWFKILPTKSAIYVNEDRAWPLFYFPERFAEFFKSQSQCLFILDSKTPFHRMRKITGLISPYSDLWLPEKIRSNHVLRKELNERAQDELPRSPIFLRLRTIQKGWDYSPDIVKGLILVLASLWLLILIGSRGSTEAIPLHLVGIFFSGVALFKFYEQGQAEIRGKNHSRQSFLESKVEPCSMQITGERFINPWSQRLQTPRLNTEISIININLDQLEPEQLTTEEKYGCRQRLFRIWSKNRANNFEEKIIYSPHIRGQVFT
jgi:hypothetical protein